MVSERETRAGERAPLWRSLLAWLAILLFCLSAPLAVFAGWTRFVLADETSYQNLVQPLAADPLVQAAVVNAVAATMQTEIAPPRAARVLAPAATPIANAATPFASPVSRAIATPVAVAIPGAADASDGVPPELLAEAATSVVRSGQFGDVWRAANLTAHRAIFAAGSGPGEPLALDLSQLAPGIQQYLDTLGIPGLDPVQASPAESALRITVLDVPAVERLRQLVDRLDLKAIALIVIALLSLLLAIAIAPGKLIALRRLGTGLVITTIVFLLALLLGQTVATGRLQNPLAAPVVQAVVDAVLTQPVLWELGLALAGLVVAVLAGLLRWASTR